MSRAATILLLVFLSSFCSNANALRPARVVPDTSAFCDTIYLQDSLSALLCNPNPELIPIHSADSSKVSNYRAKKRIAAILAFPFPFGLLGLHRVFLGTKPYIPFVYIGTLGGCFLILPIIDFVAILSANEETFKGFENNPKVFMWSH